MAQLENAAIADGRYVGTNGRLWLELRVDVQGFTEAGEDVEAPRRIVSGDVQSTGPETAAGYGSFRSVKDDLDTPPWGGAIEIDWTGATGEVSGGTLAVEPSSLLDGGVQVSLSADDEAGAPGFSGPVVIHAAYAGEALREVALEVAVEEGAGSDPAGTDPERSTTGVRVESVTERIVGSLGRAGFTVDLRMAASIPRAEGGWAESDIFATLNDVMGRTAGRGLDRPDWDLHLLVLSRTDKDALRGVMMDLTGPFPRQGAAVFVDPAASDEGDRDRAELTILHSALHELGHAFNLRHRFGRDLRRSSSTSVMNYPWRYRGGGNEDEYWAAFGEGRFDTDELAFLHHAARSQVVPGGSAFGSAVYWPAAGSRSPAAADEPWSGLQVWLTPPLGGTDFSYGQPVFVGVNLLNTGPHSVPVARHALDIKAGQLEVLVSSPPRDGASTARVADGARSFAPMLERCFSASRAEVVDLAYGESMHTNANLSYGSGGFTFPDPGGYALTPVLTFPAGDGVLDHVVQGPPLTIRVLPPRTRAEERDGEVLLARSDVGASLALGGSTALQAAAGELEDILRRRERAAASSGRPDPVTPALTRCAGISAGRQGNPVQAAALLSRATRPGAVATFDPHTAEHTRRLAARYQQDVTAEGPSVVVDLWTRPRDGGPTTSGRGSGVLVARGAPSGGSQGDSRPKGWGVLAPANHLPTEAMEDTHEVGAVVTVSSPDGLTERIAATRVDLVRGTEDGGPELALLELSHPVPPGDDVTVQAPATSSDSGLSAFFGAQGTPVAEVASLRGAQLDAWSDAADVSIAQSPRPRAPLAPAPADTVFRYPDVVADDVALKWCWLSPSCNPTPPGDDQPYDIQRRTDGDGELHRASRKGPGRGGNPERRPGKSSRGGPGAE